MEKIELNINEKAIKYYNNLKKYQKKYSESEEGKIKLRVANKRYYDKKKQDEQSMAINH